MGRILWSWWHHPNTWKESKAEWESGARAAGKNPAQMPVLVEAFVVVGVVT